LRQIFNRNLIIFRKKYFKIEKSVFFENGGDNNLKRWYANQKIEKKERRKVLWKRK
jgi:hypothetical protein